MRFAICPAVAFTVFATLSSASRSDGAPPEVVDSEIGYATVADALAAVKAQAGVQVRVQDGWTVANDSRANTIWSFAPEGDPAYPSAVKRSLVQQDGAIHMDMRIKCEASKSACDDLAKQFLALNERVRANLQRRR